MRMNILEKKQPYATMLAKGLCNATHIDEEVFEQFKRYYIFASEPVINDAAMPLRWQQEVFNQQQYGNLPETRDLPVNALVGYVDWLAHADSETSIWSSEASETTEHVVHAHEFDVPLPLPLHEIKSLDCLDMYLPSHVSINKEPYLTEYGQELVLPVSDRNFAIASRKGSFTLEMTSMLNIALTDIQDIVKVKLINGSRSKRFMFNWDLVPDNVFFDEISGKLGKERVQLVLSFDYPDHGWWTVFQRQFNADWKKVFIFAPVNW